VTQHSELSRERWSRFDKSAQIIQIGAEMQRGSRFLSEDRRAWLMTGYERVLQLVDLTVACQSNLSLRRELLRWRGLIGELYAENRVDAAAHKSAHRALLQLDPEASKQLAWLDR